MSWEMHEAAKKIADGWYSDLEATSKRNAVLGRENAKLRKLVRDMYEWAWHEYPSSVEESFLPRLHELGIEVEP